MKLTFEKDLIDACNHITKQKGDVWNVKCTLHDEYKQVYVMGYGWYNYSLFLELKDR